MFLKKILGPLKWSRSYQSKALVLKNPFTADLTTSNEVEVELLKKKLISDTSEVDRPFCADLSSEALKKKPIPEPNDLSETSEAQRPSRLSKTSEEQVSKSPLKILRASISDHCPTEQVSKSPLKILRASISDHCPTILHKSKNPLKILPSHSSISDHCSAFTRDTWYHANSKILKGTTEVFITTGNIAFAGTDGLGSDRAGKVEEYDQQKLFAFEGDNPLYGKVIMTYGGFSHYPLLIGKDIWSIEGEVTAYSVAMYAKSFRDAYKLAADEKDKDCLADEKDGLADEIDLFDFRMTFLSAEEFDTVVCQLNGLDGSVKRIGPAATIQGAGKNLGDLCYEMSCDMYYDLPTRWGYDACENYMEAFNEYMILDVLLACSQSKSEPSGGRIQVMKISPAGVERIWDNPLNVLYEERKKHWALEEVRVALGFIKKASPIEWSFADAEKSRFDRGIIDVMRSRSYERSHNFLSPSRRLF